MPSAPAQDEAYELDPEGNRLSSHLSDMHSTDTANRLESDDSYTYVYDLNGNLISKLAKAGTGLSNWTYSYDTLDQLIEVSQDGLVVESYRYDAFGRRSLISTVEGAGLTIDAGIINDGSDRAIDVVQGAVGQAIPLRRYTHGANVDEPLQLETFTAAGSFDAAYTYHADHLGSIRYLTDSGGDIVNAYDYDSYGRPLFGTTSFDQPFAYTGREWDAATGLYYYRARAYDAETGRFLQEDPIGVTIGLFDNSSNLETGLLNGTIGQSRSIENLGGVKTYNLNLYKYVENNPLIYVDYTGQISALSYVKRAKVAVRTLGKSAKFRLKKAFNILSRGPNNTIRDAKGRFASSASAQDFRRIQQVKFLQDCIKNLGTGFQVTGDVDAGLQVIGGNSLGGTIGLLFCKAAGVLIGNGV